MTLEIDYRLLLALLIVLVAVVGKAPPPRRQEAKAIGPGKPIRKKRGLPDDQHAGEEREPARAHTA